MSIQIGEPRPQSMLGLIAWCSLDRLSRHLSVVCFEGVFAFSSKLRPISALRCNLIAEYVSGARADMCRAWIVGRNEKMQGRSLPISRTMGMVHWQIDGVRCISNDSISSSRAITNRPLHFWAKSGYSCISPQCQGDIITMYTRLEFVQLRSRSTNPATIMCIGQLKAAGQIYLTTYKWCSGLNVYRHRQSIDTSSCERSGRLRW